MIVCTTLYCICLYQRQDSLAESTWRRRVLGELILSLDISTHGPAQSSTCPSSWRPLNYFCLSLCLFESCFHLPHQHQSERCDASSQIDKQDGENVQHCTCTTTTTTTMATTPNYIDILLLSLIVFVFKNLICNFISDYYEMNKHNVNS